MQTKVEARALAIVDRVLRNGPWRESAWGERERRFGSVLLESLRDQLASRPVATALNAACSAARGEVPTASAVYHETWSRVMLVWSVREIVRAAQQAQLEAGDEALRVELMRVATELAAAQAQLTLQDPQNTSGQPPFEHMVDAARDALVHVRDAVESEGEEGAFLSAYMHQVKHIASLLAVGGHSVDSLVRGAISRTDRVVRKDALRPWLDAPLVTRQAWVRRGLVEAAWGIAAQVSREQGRAETSKDVCLWLSRTACHLAARVDRVDEWVPTVPEDAKKPAVPPVTPAVAAKNVPVPPVLPPAAGVVQQVKKPESKGAEARMDISKNNPVIKTLEVDATDAAWRLAGSQFVKLARDPLVALLSRHLAPGDESVRAKVAAFLETELGVSILAAFLSMGLTAIPNTTNTDVPQKLARELRVRAMAGAGDVVADVMMGPLRQVMVMYLQGVPTDAPATEPAALPASNNPLRIPTESPSEATVEPGGSSGQNT